MSSTNGFILMQIKLTFIWNVFDEGSFLFRTEEQGYSEMADKILYLCQPQSFRKHTTNLEPCLASNGHKMPEAASETSHLRAPKKLTEDNKILVKETWREAAKPEVQAGKKLFQK